METSFVSLEEMVVISDLGLMQLVSRCLDNVAKAYIRRMQELKSGKKND